MSEIFNFNGEIVYSDELEIENIKQTNIEVIDSSGFVYYLIIKTAMGQSSCLEFGPLASDSDILPNNTSISFQRIDADEYQIKKIIKKFLSPKGSGRTRAEIVNAREVDFDTAIKSGINIFEYMKDFNDESNY